MTTPKTKRRWYQWHPSTWVFLLLFCIPYGMIALPSATFDSSIVDQRIWLHGWPTVHCAQIENANFEDVQAAKEKLDVDLFCSDNGLLLDWRKSLEDNDKRLFYWAINSYRHSKVTADPRMGFALEKFWSAPKNWNWWDGKRVSRYFLLGLFINLASFVLYVLLIGGLLELMRRRKNRWYQVTLLEYGFGIALVAVCITVVLNARREVQTKTKAMKDIVESSPSTQYGFLITEPPIWFERITNLSFDMEARGTWAGWMDFRAHNPAIPLPYFTKMDTLSIRDTVDLQKAISAIEVLQPEALELSLGSQNQSREIDLIKGLNPKGVKHLELYIQRAGGLDFDEDLLSRFAELESISFYGPVRPSNVVAAEKIQIESLAFNLVDEAVLKQVSAMRGLEHLYMRVPSHLMPRLSELPKSLQSLKLVVVPSKNNSNQDIDFRFLPELVNLEQLNLEFPLNSKERDSKIMIGDWGRFPNLQSLRLWQSAQQAKDEVPPTLEELKMEHKTIPLLTRMDLGRFTFDKKATDWIKSHQQLKRLFISVKADQAVRDQLKSELPHVEQW